MDIQVLNFQQWLNETYRFHTDWKGCPEDGKHGSATIFSMIQALQAELGYDTLSGSFGPGTLANVPVMKLGRLHDNFTSILKGSLWRAGYSGGSINQEITESTVISIKELQRYIGISQTGEVDGYLWKALMTTDGYVTTWSKGSENLRTGQQYLNNLRINNYSFAQSYLNGYLPCDGLSGRRLSTAIIKLIQANIGYGPTEASGNLGPATQKALPTLQGGSSPYITVAKLALMTNGYEIPNTSPVWDVHIGERIKEFQKDMSLPNTSKLDFSTWMSLLISYGDKNRKYTTCDTRFEITAERLATLKTMGIEAVGRYINGTSFKILRKNEYKRLIDAGMGLIPIYQQNALSSDDFSYEIGKEQGSYAQESALDFGIPGKSIIYFAVDYDAQDWEISNFIIPYFRGVKEKCPYYKIGVYGTRNVCQRVADAGLTVSSYVSNMSSGFSGNLGFKMPTNWNFDQFDEINIGDWGIDKVSFSGKHSYVTSYVSKSAELSSFFEGLKMVEDLVYQSDRKTNTLQYLRYPSYFGGFWDAALGLGGSEFVDEDLEKEDPLLHDFFSLYKDKNSELKGLLTITPEYQIDLPHFAYTCLKYYDDRSILIPTFWTGWGGDLATLGGEVKLYRQKKEGEGIVLSESELKTYAQSLMGGDSTFSASDYHADLDAIYIAEKANTDQYLAETMEKYYLSGEYKTKSEKFAKHHIGNNEFNVDNLIKKITKVSGGLTEHGMWWKLGGSGITDVDKNAAIYAFCRFVFKEIDKQ